MLLLAVSQNAVRSSERMGQVLGVDMKADHRCVRAEVSRVGGSSVPVHRLSLSRREIG
jgi:hypothetical protein